MAGSQDMFDAIVMADERFHGEGYREGYEEGSSLGVMEGRQHGTLHGAKIGSEIGCYQGFAFAWKCLLHSCTAEKDSGKKRMRRYRRRNEACLLSGCRLPTLSLNDPPELEAGLQPSLCRDRRPG
ncbi:protein LTO1 homolog isoform X2 [Cebus imitator]|uniref:protein LTO1 homolog isoform X2 n=1 Tax=Cebus imitator TaxID=2715852 RepID=UPI000809EDC2|nr:protein LTO1 homolog isoform X2 [Cebus imitator]XP_037589933.1 protein LTO1 homolog isoform X2 [Cebus imitator]